MKQGKVPYTELVIFGMAMGENIPYSHSVACILHSNQIAIADGYASEVQWWRNKPAAFPGETVSLKDLFENYQALSAYKITRVEVGGEERETLERELRYIMTGRKQVEAIKEKVRENIAQTNEKKALTTKKRKRKASLSLYKSKKLKTE